MRLDGEVYPLADGFCSVAEIDSPALRAAALVGSRSHRLIVDGMSAAWVWGALDVMPTPTEFCVALGRRARLPPSDQARVREVVIDPDDVVLLDGIGVVHPLRVTIDIARTREVYDDFAVVVTRRLSQAGEFTRHMCTELLNRRHKLPGKVRAIQRLDQAFGAEWSASAHAVDVVHTLNASHCVQQSVEVHGVTHFENKTTDR
ncbi:MAG TPA: hypothetical protein VNT53_05865 [Pseudolysinimonas sp.]|nr:hypothetical protein [Pseudolysinimonas sp.]